jgi:hypothetical protein
MTQRKYYFNQPSTTQSSATPTVTDNLCLLGALNSENSTSRHSNNTTSTIQTSTHPVQLRGGELERLLGALNVNNSKI